MIRPADDRPGDTLGHGGTTDAPASGRARADAIVARFRSEDEPGRLALLLQYAELPQRMADLPPDAGFDLPAECGSGIAVHASLGGDGRVLLRLRAVEGGPTARAFANLLTEVFDGLSPDEGLQVPPDLLMRLGLSHALSAQRLAAVTRVVTRIRGRVAELGAAGTIARDAAPA